MLKIDVLILFLMKIVSNELKDLLKENQELAKKVEEILDMQ